MSAIVVNGRYQAHRITGVQRYAHEIVSRIAPSVDLLVPRNGKGPLGHLWEQTALPALCRGRLLWSPSASGPVFYQRQVVTIHDLFAIEHPEWYSASYSNWYRVMMKSIISRAVALIAVSHYTKSRLVSVLGCDPDRITVIRNGLTTECRRTDGARIQQARAALSIPAGPYVLSLSSLEARKNLKTILTAWLALRQDVRGSATLVLAGAKPDPAVYAAQNLPQDLPNVHFTGYLPEEHLAALYSGASVFLFPSLAEGFGIPLLEAMACGVRCITSSTSSLPEVGGDVVTYVDPLNSTELAGAIHRLLNEGASPERPFEPAMERARQFCWSEAAGKTLSVLEQAAAQSELVTLSSGYPNHGG